MANLVDEYGPKQMEDFEKMNTLPPIPPHIPAETQSQQSSFQWLDEMLFGWSTTKKAAAGRSGLESVVGESQSDSRAEEDAQYSMPGSFSLSNAQTLSQQAAPLQAPLIPTPNVLEDGDFDKVVSFLEAPSLSNDNTNDKKND